jgi:single-strand DNA-binding protein
MTYKRSTEMSVNKVMLLGRLGKNPEMATTPSGTRVTKFSIATSEGYKDKTTGEKKEKTEWHNVICFNKTAEIAGQYLAKGRQVFIDGKIQTRSYDDKAGGKRYITEIICNNLQLIGGDKKEAAPTIDKNFLDNSEFGGTNFGGNQAALTGNTKTTDFSADDIPF